MGRSYNVTGAGCDDLVMTTRELNRDELYERVWTTPMRTLAGECGVSDVALAKTCHRLGIPTPPRGYWAQLAAGKRVIDRPPLPPATRGQIGFRIAVGAPRPVPPRVERPDVPIRRDLRRCHDAIRELGLALADARIDAKDRLTIEGAEGTTFAVTPEHHKRALLLLDAFARAVTERGHVVEFVRGDRDPHAGTLIVTGEDRIAISMIEKLDPIDHRPTEEEKERIARGYGHGIAKHDHVPVGHLRLGFLNGTIGRAAWADTETRRLDGQLPSAVIAIEAEIARRHEIAEEREQRRREEEARRTREQEALRRARAREEQARHVAQLEAHLRELSERWTAAAKLRAFVDEVERVLVGDERRELVDAWLAFARDAASRLDPLSQPRAIPQPVPVSVIERERS